MAPGKALCAFMQYHIYDIAQVILFVMLSASYTLWKGKCWMHLIFWLQKIESETEVPYCKPRVDSKDWASLHTPGAASRCPALIVRGQNCRASLELLRAFICPQLYSCKYAPKIQSLHSGRLFLMKWRTQAQCWCCLSQSWSRIPLNWDKANCLLLNTDGKKLFCEHRKCHHDTTAFGVRQHNPCNLENEV